MAGTLTLTTLSDGTNSTSATNCIRGSAKAWVNFNGLTTVTIRTSYNVSSVTRNSAGYYTVAFTNALADANYVVTGSAQWNGAAAMPTVEPYNNASGTKIAPTPTGFDFVLVGSGALAQIQDSEIINISVLR